jgi:hypothetical protein
MEGITQTIFQRLEAQGIQVLPKKPKEFKQGLAKDHNSLLQPIKETGVVQFYYQLTENSVVCVCTN